MSAHRALSLRVTPIPSRTTRKSSRPRASDRSMCCQITALSPRVRWHKVVRAIVDDKLAIVFAAVLYGERPDGGVVGHSVTEEFRCIVQPCVALLLNHFGSVGDGLLHEFDDVGLGLETVTRRIVALAEVGPEI